MATSGAQSGTDIYVLMDTTVPGSSYTQVGGQNSHTITLNNQVIDITNKSSADYRELLPDEGLQSLDLTLEMTFNSDTQFAALRALAGSKADAAFQVNMPTTDLAFVGMVSNFTETSPSSDKLTASVTILSTGTITWGA